MSERVFYPDTDDVSSTSKVVALSIARNRTREMIFPIHAFLSRHSFSVGGSLIRTADQARGKVGVVKWACAYGGGEDGSPSEARNAIQEARN